MSWKLSLGVLVTSMALFTEAVAGYQLQVGDSYAIKDLSKTELNLTIQKEKVKIAGTQKLDLTLNVAELNTDGTYSAVVTLDSFSNEWNNQDPKQFALVQDLYRALIGQTFKVTFSPNGNVLKLIDYDIPARLCALVPEGKDKEAVCKMLNAAWSEDFVKDIIDGLLNLCSSEKKPWEKTTLTPALPGLKVIRTVTLGVCGENPNEIPFTSGLSLAQKSGSFMGHENFVFEGKGSGQGQFSTDPITGWCLSRTHTTSIAGNVSLNQQGVKMKLPLKGTITQTTKSKKLN